MKVQVRLFARYREAAGRDRVELDLPEGGTVEAAWEAVTSRFPSLSAYRPFTLFAVGNDYVGPERSLRPGEELCLFPPVSGGSDDLVDLVAAPLSEKALVAAVEDPGAGAVVLFSGVVRDQTGGRRVKFLEYEAHAPMAVAKTPRSGPWTLTATVVAADVVLLNYMYRRSQQNRRRHQLAHGYAYSPFAS